MPIVKCKYCKEEYYVAKQKNFICVKCRLKKLNPKITKKQTDNIIQLMNQTIIRGL